MLYAFFGTDRHKARAAMNAAAGKKSIVRISDANSLDDLKAALSTTTSMFGEKQTVILDSVCAHEEMRTALLAALPALKDSEQEFFLLEDKPDAELKKKLQKYAEKIETFDAIKKKEYPTIFKLADHLKSGDKKNMWVAYQRELAAGEAPEAIHGILFWGAKQFLLGARRAQDVERGRDLVAALAQLPHESRRRGEELEYALELFILSRV